MNYKRQKSFVFTAFSFLVIIAVFSLSGGLSFQEYIFAQNEGEIKEGEVKEGLNNKIIDKQPEKPVEEHPNGTAENPVPAAKKPEVKKSPSPIKNKIEKAEKQNKSIPHIDAKINAGTKDSREAANIKPVNRAQEGVKNDELLDITDGAFKYKRIPGIKISDKAREIVKPSANSKYEKQATNDAKSTTEKKGLFGLTQKTTDFLAKLILFGIIIVVLILYRYRTRGRRSSVLKRFPK